VREERYSIYTPRTAPLDLRCSYSIWDRVINYATAIAVLVAAVRYLADWLEGVI